MQKRPSVFHAYHLTDRIKLTSILKLFPEKPYRASGTEIAFRFGKSQYLIIYNFGSLVFFDVDPVKESQIVAMMEQFVLPKDQIVTREEFHLEEGKTLAVEFTRVVLDSITYERIQIVALVLAQSTALDFFENVVETVLAKSGTFSELLEKHGRIRGRKAVDVMKFIGFCLNTKQKVVSSTYLLDNPDPTWDDPQLEKLFKQMTEMFEIRDRFRTLEYKLRTIQEIVEILSELSKSQRALYLELIIILLIAVEVVLFLAGYGGGK